ncbi:MAG: DUF1285 domain-containing protein [bacterium]
MNATDSLFNTLTSLQAGKKLPPVELWQPERSGRIDIVINDQGEWLHEGSRIRRQPLVDLFATILRREGDDYYLVTPAEKLAIEVSDVPFIATDLDVRGSGQQTDLLFTTNVGDYVMAGPEHALTMRAERPYLHVRNGLEARLSRSVYYRLVDKGVEVADHLYVYSQGQAFDLGMFA